MPQCPFLEIHFNIIFLFTPRFANQIPVCSSPVSNTCQIPNPSHALWCYHPNNTWWEVLVQIIKLKNSLHSPVTSYLLAPNTFLSALFFILCCLVISKRYYWRSLNILHQSWSIITAKEQLFSISRILPAAGIGFVSSELENVTKQAILAKLEICLLSQNLTG